MQPEIDKIVTQLVEYYNPLRQNLPRRTGSGDAWYINRRTPGLTGGVFVTDIATFTEDTGTYAQTSFAFKTIGVQGRVTRKSQAIGKTYSNILADELEAKAQEFRDKEDWAYLWSNVSLGAAGYDANGFDGLNAFCNTATGNVVCTADSGTVPAALTLADLDQALDTVRGNPDMIITSKRTRRRINALLQAQQRFIDKIEVRGGFKVMSYNEVPIFVSSNMYDTLTFNQTGLTITALTGGTSSALFVLDTAKVFSGVLTELTVMPLAKTTSQYDAFDIFVDEAIVCRDPMAIVNIIGIQ
jgi:hypothetical protein